MSERYAAKPHITSRKQPTVYLAPKASNAPYSQPERRLMRVYGIDHGLARVISQLQNYGGGDG